MKVDLQSFIEGSTSFLTGAMAGQMAGEQMARQQQEQEFNRQFNLSQIGANQQNQQNTRLLGQFGNMTPESQAQALTDINNQPSAYAGLLNTRYAQAHPEIAGLIGAAPGQRLPPPVAGAAALGMEGQPVFTHGGKQYALKGFDKAEAAKVTSLLEKTYDDMARVALTDPNQIAARDELLRQKGGLRQIKTPEDLARAQTLLNQAKSFHATVGGPQAAAFQQRQLKDRQSQFETEVEKDIGNLSGQALVGVLPGHLQTEDWIREQRGRAGYGGKGLSAFKAEIEALPGLAKTDPAKAEQQAEMIKAAISGKQSPADQSKRISNFYKILSMIAPTDRTPERIRQLAKNNGLEGLLTGLDDEGLLLGGAAAEKALQGLIGRMSTQNFARLDKTAQGALLNEASTLAGYLKRKVPIPAEIVAKMTPWQQAQVGMQRDRLAISGDLRDIAWQNMMISNARLGLEERKLTAAQKQNKFTPQQLQTIAAKKKAFSDAQEQLKTTLERLPVLPGNVDLDNPKTDAERLYAELIGKMRAAEDDYVGFMGSLGIEVNTVTDTGFKPTPAPEKPKTERKTILGIPYGPEVPVEGRPGQTKQGAAVPAGATTGVKVDRANLVRRSSVGHREAQTLLKSGQMPATQRAIDQIKQVDGAGRWEEWVSGLPAEAQDKAWTIYWWIRGRTATKK